ncbi:UNVERIFIED_ORG: putative transposase/invertase (TIGR01784 family) [Heyndrickxia coagulans]
MKTEYLDLKMDFMFKQLFGHPSRKNITIAFLNDLLNRKGQDRIVDVQYENTELVQVDPDSKTNPLVALFYTSNHEKILVKIQEEYQQDMPKQVLAEWAKCYALPLPSGINHTVPVPTIMLLISNVPLFPHKTDRIHNVFQLLEDDVQTLRIPHLEFQTFDLTKFMSKWKKYRELKEEPPEAYPWLMMLSAVDYRKKTMDTKILQALKKWEMNGQEVAEAIKEWESLSANPENQERYEARLKCLRG